MTDQQRLAIENPCKVPRASAEMLVGRHEGDPVYIVCITREQQGGLMKLWITKLPKRHWPQWRGGKHGG